MQTTDWKGYMQAAWEHYNPGMAMPEAAARLEPPQPTSVDWLEATRRQAELAAQAHSRKIARQLQKIGDMASVSFDSFVPVTEAQALALARMRAWCSGWASVLAAPVVVLVGPPGVGKTFLAVSALRALANLPDADGRLWVPRYENESTFRRRWQSAHDNYGGGAGVLPHQLRNGCCNAPVLVWDDLATTSMTGSWVDTLYSIVDYRLGQMMPTIYTTNPESFVTLPGKLKSRLLGGMVIPMDGPDGRLRGHAMTV